MNMTPVTTSRNLNPWGWFTREPRPDNVLGMTRRNDPLTNMHSQLDRMFDQFFADFPMSIADPGTSFDNILLRPNLDITESAKQYTITVEVPGVDEKDIDITLEQDTLVISGEKKQETSKEENGYQRMERSYGRFQRVLSLPDDADTGNIKADCKNGVLKIRIARRKDARPAGNRIPISH